MVTAKTDFKYDMQFQNCSRRQHLIKSLLTMKFCNRMNVLLSVQRTMLYACFFFLI